jgi:hypothetical protein
LTFAQRKAIALDAYDRIVGLSLDDIAIDEAACPLTL